MQKTISRPGRGRLGVTRLAAVLMTAVCVGCSFFDFDSDNGDSGGSGGDPSDTDPTLLAGSWFGSLFDREFFDAHSLEIVIDDEASIQSLRIDGVDGGVTGTVQAAGDSVFRFVLSNGTVGGLYADKKLQHVTFVGELLLIGVLERGATEIPIYEIDDPFSTRYLGPVVAVSPRFVPLRVVGSEAAFVDDGQFAGQRTDGTVFRSTSDIIFDVPEFGVWTTLWAAPGTDGVATFLLSPDKTFLATAACDVTVLEWSECEFGAYSMRE